MKVRIGIVSRQSRDRAGLLGLLLIAASTTLQARESPAPELLPFPSGMLAPNAAGGPGAGAATDDLAIRCDQITRRLEALEQDAAARGAASGKGSGADVCSDKWTVKLGGHVQMDYILWPNADPAIPAQNYFEFRRLRLLAEGIGYGVYDFRLQMEFAEPDTQVKDAYFTANQVPYFDRVRIGNFFVPFSLEQVTNDTNNIFMERSIPTQGIFAADREVGIAHYGVNDAKNFTWTFGTFFDSISESLKESIDDNQGQRFSGRLTWLLYYDEASNGRYLVHLGAGLLHTEDQDDRVRFRARPQIHEGPFLIETGNVPASNYTSANLEFAAVWGPFSLQSETFATQVNLLGDDNANVYGGYVYGSWFITGENRKYERYGQHGAQFGRSVPLSNFFWLSSGCGPGAWEIKTRWSNLTLRELDAGQYNDFTLGVNWYWSDRTRIMLDWIHPMTSAATVYGPTHSDIIAMRFDFNF
jgi:phosphate-selective porin OprO/OprP